MNDRDGQPQKVRSSIYTLQPIVLTTQGRDKLYGSILDSSQLGTEYLTMLALAGLLALFGLLQNSVAVIIGAMLISPLMNPILSAALALLLGDWSLGRKSGIILALSIGGVITITWLVAWLSPLKQVTPEILARTNPNLLDLFIAFLSGLAGTLAMRGSSSSLTIIPGVAIAVAVVPPLAAVGYGLSTHQWHLAGGAFLLFVTNLVAIIISAALVFRIMGFRPHKEAEEGRQGLLYRMALSAGILIVLSIPLFQTLRKAVGQIRLHAEIQDALNATFKTPHSSVSEMHFTEAGTELRVHATLRTTRYVETKQIAAAEESLRNRFGAGAKLEMDQILVAMGGINPVAAAAGDNAISGGVVRPALKTPPFSFSLASEQILANLQKNFDEIVANTSIQRIGETGLGLSPTPPLSVNVQLASAAPIDPQSAALLSSQLSSKLSVAVQIHGQVMLSDPAYAATLEIPETSRRLALKEREQLIRLARLVAGRPDLELMIAYVPASPGTKESVWPPQLPEVQQALSLGGLKPSRWNAQPGGNDSFPSAGVVPPASNVNGATAAPAVVVRYEFQTYQHF